MRITISGKNIEITSGLKDAVNEKLGKLEKYFTQETEMIVTLSVEKGRQKIEVTIPVRGSVIRAEQESDDMYISIDLVQEIIERQMRKYKTKLVNRYRNSGHFQQSYIDMEVTDPDEIKIVRTKRFAIKPMDPEEACVQMASSDWGSGSGSGLVSVQAGSATAGTTASGTLPLNLATAASGCNVEGDSNTVTWVYY